MNATWLADVLRAEGLHVVEMDGWKSRETRPGFEPQGLVWHDTVTSKSTPDENVRRLLRDGRPDLAGPLVQLGLERDGTFVTIASGRCNHNGYGTWGNDAFGIEAYNDGVGEPWPPAQLDAYDRGSAAICRKMGWSPASHIKAHRETDPKRKIDPTGIDMNAARIRVQALLNGDDDDMIDPKQWKQMQDDMAIVKAAVTDDSKPESLAGRMKRAVLGINRSLDKSGGTKV